jgi:hypothetical protein
MKCYVGILMFTFHPRVLKCCDEGGALPKHVTILIILIENGLLRQMG